MALLIRTIKNTTIFPVEFSIPGNDGTHPPVKLAVGDTLDLLTTLTADELLVLQAQLEGLRDRGSISVVATLDSFTLTKAYSGSSLDTEALQDTAGVVHVSAAAAPSTGQVLTATDATHATWQTPSGGGGTPAGSTGAIQFNTSGSFAADTSNLFWDNTKKGLGVGTANITSSLDVVRFTSIDGATHSFRVLSADNLQGDIGDSVNPNNDWVADSTGSCTAGLMARSGDVTLLAISHGQTGAGALLVLKSGNGTFASPSQTLNQDPLGQILFGGSAGVHPMGVSSAAILAVATDNYTLTAKGAELNFSTTSMGTVTRKRRLKITHDGGLQYNGLTSDPNTAEGNTGKIYFNKTSQTFQVSQNGGGYVPLSTPPAGSSGDLQFNNGSGSFGSDTGNLFWDSTNKGLGVGTSAVTSSLDVVNFSSRDGSTHSVRVQTADTVSDSILLNGAAPIDLLVTNDKGVFAAFVTKDASANGGTSVQAISYGASSGFSLKSQNGTLDAPSASVPGNILGQFGFGGGNGSAAFSGSSIFLEGVARETFSGGNKGASLRIKTTKIGTGTRAIRWEIMDDGANQYYGITSPAVSSSNNGKIYFDSGLETFQVSQNGGSYVPLVAAGASGTFTTTDLKTVTVVNGLITSIV